MADGVIVTELLTLQSFLLSSPHPTTLLSNPYEGPLTFLRTIHLFVSKGNQLTMPSPKAYNCYYRGVLTDTITSAKSLAG